MTSNVYKVLYKWQKLQYNEMKITSESEKRHHDGEDLYGSRCDHIDEDQAGTECLQMGRLPWDVCDKGTAER